MALRRSAPRLVGIQGVTHRPSPGGTVCGVQTKTAVSSWLTFSICNCLSQSMLYPEVRTGFHFILVLGEKTSNKQSIFSAALRAPASVHLRTPETGILASVEENQRVAVCSEGVQGQPLSSGKPPSLLEDRRLNKRAPLGASSDREG